MENKYLEKIGSKKMIKQSSFLSSLKPTLHSITPSGGGTVERLVSKGLSNREAAKRLTNKYLDILGPTLKKLEGLPREDRIAIGMGHW
jgi:hypothetical protein